MPRSIKLLIIILLAAVAIVLNFITISISPVHAAGSRVAFTVEFETAQTPDTLPGGLQNWVNDESHQFVTCNGELSDTCWKGFASADELDAVFSELSVVVHRTDAPPVIVHRIFAPLVINR